MGCDIHTAVEYTQDGKSWVLAGERQVHRWTDRNTGEQHKEVSNWHLCPPADLKFELDEWEQKSYVDGDKNPDYRRPIWKGRNYNLFAALAGVRNYDEITPMSESRGWPMDICKTLHWGWEPVGDVEFDDPDGPAMPWVGHPDLHTPSYFTLEELLLFDYSRVCGKSFRELKRPVAHDQPNAAGIKRAYTKRQYKITYRQYMGDRFFADVEVLRRWANGRGLDPSWVRVVSAFDN